MAAAAQDARIGLGNFHLKCKAFRCESSTNCKAVGAHEYVRVCVCLSAGVCLGLGQLCTINKVIHLPQKLFENLHSVPAGPNSTPALTRRQLSTCSQLTSIRLSPPPTRLDLSAVRLDSATA